MTILRVILALVAGVVIGGIVNMALVMLGSAIVAAYFPIAFVATKLGATVRPAA